MILLPHPCQGPKDQHGEVSEGHGGCREALDGPGAATSSSRTVHLQNQAGPGVSEGELAGGVGEGDLVFQFAGLQPP